MVAALLVILAGKAPALDVDLARFVTAKETQTRELAEAQTNKVPAIIRSFFDAVRVDDWQTATNVADQIDKAGGRDYGTNTLSPALRTALWQPICETLGAYEQFHEWDNRLLHRFGSNVIASIPKGSVYLGGTDPGRFVVSALCESQRDGRPFFTLTQNQFADARYLEYLRSMYGRMLRLPSDEENRALFKAYVEDAQKRKAEGRLLPGEIIQDIAGGKVQISGYVAVMQVNGTLARFILETNANREFYIEESYAVDWMYPHLAPHGLILRLHPKPLATLREETVRQDQAFWKKLTGELIGDWITDQTSVREICDFADRVYGSRNLARFKGDRAYASNPAAQKCFSKLRSSIAGVYCWRAQHARDEAETGRMRPAAELALKQTFALCPYSPEAVYRYTRFLAELKRTDEALLIAQSASRLDPGNADFQAALKWLRAIN